MLHVEIVTPGRVAWKGECTEVQIPGELGEIGALDGHAPLLTLTRCGVFRANADGQEVVKVVGAGFAEVTPLGVTLLVDSCEEGGAVDKSKAEAQLEAAEKALAESAMGTEEWARNERDAELARARLAV